MASVARDLAAMLMGFAGVAIDRGGEADASRRAAHGPAARRHLLRMVSLPHRARRANVGRSLLRLAGRDLSG